jgi:hypothetical protein
VSLFVLKQRSIYLILFLDRSYATGHNTASAGYGTASAGYGTASAEHGDGYGHLGPNPTDFGGHATTTSSKLR